MIRQLVKLPFYHKMNFDKENKEITDDFFAEIKDTFFFQIHRIQKTIFRKGNQMFQDAEIGLQVEQFPILMVAAAYDGLSQQEIADITRRDKSSIQRTVVALVKKNLLKVSQDADDKRRNMVYATEEGKLLSKRIKKLIKKAEDEAFSVLPEEEKQSAIKSLKEVADKLEKQ